MYKMLYQNSDKREINNLAVRKILKERGVQPENLPPAEDVNKVERRLKGDEKKLLKDVKKKNDFLYCEIFFNEL